MNNATQKLTKVLLATIVFVILAGIVFTAGVGDRVQESQPLAEIHLSNESSTKSVEERLLSCYKIESSQPERRPIILDRISASPKNNG